MGHAEEAFMATKSVKCADTRLGKYHKGMHNLGLSLSGKYELSVEGLLNPIIGEVASYESRLQDTSPEETWDPDMDLNAAIERQTFYRALIDQAVLIFNQHGVDSALEFLEKHAILERRNTMSVAAFLFKQRGLDKRKVGEFLGREDEFSIAVLRHFVHFYDFSDTQIDFALRLMLSKFEPPGEAQQLYRILYQFACLYSKVNQAKKLDADQAHLLSYAILLLHTDIHNPQVKKKMTKHEFCNSLSYQPNIGLSWLEGVYDRIAGAEFKLEFTEADKVYSRLSGFLHIPRRASAAISRAPSIEDIERLKTGSVFKKYCRNGKVKYRLVRISQDLTRVIWSAVRSVHERKEPRSLPLDGMLDVTVGAYIYFCVEKVADYSCATIQWSNISKRFKISEELEGRFLCLHYADRTLDLCAPKDLDPPLQVWTGFFQRNINKRISRRKIPADPLQLQRKIIEMQEIISAAENSCLKGLVLLQNKHPKREDEEKEKFWREHIALQWDSQSKANDANMQENFYFRNFFTKSNWHKKKEKASASPIVKRWWERDSFAGGGAQSPFCEELQQSSLSAKLLDAWYLGIPPSCRAQLWALAIGNAQRATPNLYHLSLEYSRAILSSSEKSSALEGISRRLTRLREDIPDIVGSLLQDHVWKERCKPVDLLSDCNNSSSSPEGSMADLKNGEGASDTTICYNISEYSSESTKANTVQSKDKDTKDALKIDKDGKGTMESLMNSSTSVQYSPSDRVKDSYKKKTIASLEEGVHYRGSWINEENIYQFQTEILNVLEAYVVHRPDFGCMKGVGNIAGMLLLYLEPSNCFQCFVNLLHSHHFLDFLLLSEASSRRRITMRFELFQALFRTRLPILSKHFKGLEITPDLYLMGWMITLFTQVLPQRVAGRVWDCFILKGEVFALQTALAILKYYETTLLNNSFEGCLRILNRNAHPLEDYYGVFDEEKFFSYVKLCTLNPHVLTNWQLSNSKQDDNQAFTATNQ